MSLILGPLSAGVVHRVNISDIPGLQTLSSASHPECNRQLAGAQVIAQRAGYLMLAGDGGIFMFGTVIGSARAIST